MGDGKDLFVLIASRPPLDPWFGELSSHSAGLGGGSKEFTTGYLRGRQKDTQEREEEPRGFTALLILGSEEGQDCVLIAQWISQVYSHLFITQFCFLMKR